MSYEDKIHNDGISWNIIGEVTTPADDTDAGFKNSMRAFIPNVDGTVTVRLESGGTAYTIPVKAGDRVNIMGIYSFDATGTDSTNITILA